MMTVPEDKADSHYMITYRMHEYRMHCQLHKSFVNTEKGKKNVCPQCAILPKEKKAQYAPKSRQDPVKKTAPLGLFMKIFAEYIDKKWRQHNWQVSAFGSGYCKKFRAPEEILKMEGHQDDVHVIRDFADRLKCSYDKATQSGEMGGAMKNIGQEGFYYAIFNKETQEVEKHWHAYLSDEKQQDARICFVNTCRFIEMVREKWGKLMTPGSTLWMQSDGCVKQYKCAYAAWMCTIISLKYSITLDWMVTAAGHGKCLVDSMSGAKKH